MKVKVFVNWSSYEIINEAKYKEKIRRKVVKTMADKQYFYDWLSETYTPQAIWELTEAGRNEVQKLWEYECKDIAEANSDFEMVEIEI